jgi:hypothetical protein
MKAFFVIHGMMMLDLLAADAGQRRMNSWTQPSLLPSSD